MSHNVTSLSKEALTHKAVRHPYLRALEHGDLPDPAGALKDFAHQYSAYSSRFRSYLQTTISKLTNPSHKEHLHQNLMEECGLLSDDEIVALENIGLRKEWVQGIPHPILFKRFQSSLGITADWLRDNPYCDEALVWSDSLMELIRCGDGANAVGALGLGTEYIVKYIYRPIFSAIRNHLDISPEESVFFPLHCEVDDEHALTLQQIAEELIADSPENYRKMREGMFASLNLRARYWDAMLARARRMPARRRNTACLVQPESYTTTQLQIG